MWKFIVPFGLFALLGVFLYIGLHRDPSYVPSPLIGKQAPEFTLPSLQDPAYPVSSKDLAGRPWVLTYLYFAEAVAGNKVATYQY